MSSPRPGDSLPELRRQPDEVGLFLASAALWVPHRIHYDRDHTRAEGHADLLVHGPLQGAWLGSLVSAWAGTLGGRMTSLRWRNRRPLMVGQGVLCGGKVLTAADGVASAEVWVAREGDGERTTVGRAEVALG